MYKVDSLNPKIMKYYLIILLPFALFYGCMQKDNEQAEKKINSAYIERLVQSAIDSSVAANNELAGLIDYSLPLNNNYNSLKVDSIKTNSGEVYYFVLLEHPNPVYNIFAVYDTSLTLLLLDKSLNGNLSAEAVTLSGKPFIKVNEGFISKDVLVLNRLSLYEPDSSKINLVFRTHTKLAKPDIEYFQELKELNDSLILTKMSSSADSPISNLGDKFSYDSTIKKYKSEKDTFDLFVIKEVAEFKHEAEKTQLTGQ
jgi:hypothetical protein